MADVGFLLTIRSDEGVDLGDVDVVQLLDCILDLRLVGALVDDEDEGVVVLNLLHGRLGCQGEFDNLELIKLGPVGGTPTWVLGLTGKVKDLGASELYACALLALPLVMHTSESGFLGLECLILGGFASPILGLNRFGGLLGWSSGLLLGCHV